MIYSDILQSHTMPNAKICGLCFGRQFLAVHLTADSADVLCFFQGCGSIGYENVHIVDYNNWAFPKNRGTPSHHPLLDWDVP